MSWVIVVLPATRADFPLALLGVLSALGVVTVLVLYHVLHKLSPGLVRLMAIGAASIGALVIVGSFAFGVAMLVSGVPAGFMVAVLFASPGLILLGAAYALSGLREAIARHVREEPCIDDQTRLQGIQKELLQREETADAPHVVEFSSPNLFRWRGKLFLEAAVFTSKWSLVAEPMLLVVPRNELRIDGPIPAEVQVSDSTLVEALWAIGEAMSIPITIRIGDLKQLMAWSGTPS
jgi:hypothetical protein